MLLVPETNKGQQSWDWYAQVSSVLRLLVTATTARPNPKARALDDGGRPSCDRLVAAAAAAQGAAGP